MLITLLIRNAERLSLLYATLAGRESAARACRAYTALTFVAPVR